MDYSAAWHRAFIPGAAAGLLIVSVQITVAWLSAGTEEMAPFSGASSTHAVAGRLSGAGTLPSSTRATDTVTQVLMRNVDFYVAPDIVLHIRRLRGTMASKAGGPIVFDDKHSFTIHIATAEVGLTGKDLSALMNEHLFAYRGAPLKHLEVTTSGSEIVQRGILHKGIDIPFEIRAQVGVTPHGLIRIHPIRTKILGVNGDALMKALGLSLEKLIDLSKAKGATVHGNDIFLDPGLILPPPSIEGQVTSVRVEGDQIVQRFGEGATPSVLVPPDTVAPNFMYYRGGTLQFGRLLMLDAKMQIVDLDHSGVFAFDLDRYNAQLIAGYSRTLPDLGLEVYMCDIDKLNGGCPAQVTLH